MNVCIFTDMKRLFTALFLILSVTLASGQGYPNGLSADSVDPENDAAFISEMKVRMDKVRSTQHRPTVALVLSGGGARGSAHVGVLKFLEEMEIPVDMICGTSMGGLMGGLYSMGYSADQLDSLLKKQDWSLILSDNISEKYKPYKEKLYRSRYVLTIPFHYESADDNPRHIRDLNIGVDAGDISTQSGMNTFASSLPSGYVVGFNINNLLSSLTVGYQDSLAFSSLPIPYFAVATDMVSCKAKNWGSGSIRSAMRSTMSIPGLFSPVWTDDRLVLVDGGTRNNFPADLARAMGADYVIGVELSAAAAEKSEVDNIGNIVMRIVRMLGQDAYNKNIGEADILIRPELDGYGMLSFETAAIDTMITRGYRAAVSSMDELAELKSHTASGKTILQARPAVDIAQHPVNVSSISFSNMSDRESRTMMRKIGLDITKKMSKDDLDVAMQEIVAVPAIETATYSLLGSGEPYQLQFKCIKKPVHQLGTSFRMDTQDWAALLLDIGLNANKLEGSKLDFESRIAQNFYAKLHYSFDLLALPTFNAEVKWFSNSHDFVSEGENTLFHAKYQGTQAAVYLSNSRWISLNLQGGAKFKQFRTRSMLSDILLAYSDTEDVDPFLNGKYFSVFANTDVYTYNDKYFPTRGIDFSLDGEWVFNPSCAVLALDYGQAIGMGQHFAVTFDIHGRSLIGNQPCLYLGNSVGGFMDGRYWEHQVPFVGFNRMYAAYEHLLVGNLELRANPLKNFYVSLMGGAFNTSDELSGMLTESSTYVFGAALQAAYHTIIGPIRARLNWSTFDHKLGYCISAGFDF